jgi:hypothetical protein
MPDALFHLRNRCVTVDLLLGVSIMGTTGAVIGFYLGGPLAIGLGVLSGSVLGGFISTLGARTFFVSVLAGTAAGTVLALWLGGPDTLVIGAGSGAATGGFVGVNLGLFRK